MEAEVPEGARLLRGARPGSVGGGEAADPTWKPELSGQSQAENVGKVA